MRDKMIAVALIRYVVFVLFVVMIAHCGLLVYGFDLHIAEIALVTGGFVLVHSLSKVLGFCAWHRAMIQYDYVVIACIWWQRWIGFGQHLNSMRCTMFAIGISLLVSFVTYKLISAKNDRHRYKK